METPAAPPVPRPAGLRTELPITTAAPVKKQRRYAAAALSTVLAVAAALGAAAAVSAVGDRTKVLAIANDVPAGQPLTDADIIVAEVSADSALTPMPATDRASVVGKRPAVDLRKGSLLVAGQLQPGTGLGRRQAAGRCPGQARSGPRGLPRPGGQGPRGHRPRPGRAAHRQGRRRSPAHLRQGGRRLRQPARRLRRRRRQPGGLLLRRAAAGHPRFLRTDRPGPRRADRIV
ncbi:LOW QUALITY PROTEIN: membrane protein, partial [Streptomyces sp. C]